METIKIDKYLTDEEVIEKQKEIEKNRKGCYLCFES